jgi:hypothetical protein
MNEEKTEESEENCVETVMPLQGSAAKVKKVLSDLQKESLKQAPDAATIYRKQLRDEKQLQGIVDKKGLSKLQMRLRDLQGLMTCRQRPRRRPQKNRFRKNRSRKFMFFFGTSGETFL